LEGWRLAQLIKMKNPPGLGINTRVSHIFHAEVTRTLTDIFQIARLDKKYFGDPESPNFLPDSPLIERPVLSSQQEKELKWICSLVLANVQSSDNSGTDPLSEIIQSLQAQEALPLQDAPRHKVQFSARNATKPAASSRQQAAAKNEVRSKQERHDAGARNVPAKLAFTDSPTAQPISANSNDEVLWAIRSRMGSRPKTSAAACVDYAGENTDPSSHPSNRTTYTTYSTPATSIGCTTAGGKKSYTQDEPAMPTLDLYGLLSQGDSPSRDSAQVRAWMDEQYEHRHLHSANGFEYPTNSSLREFYPTPRPEEAEQLRKQGKRNSIRTNIQEYFRPGSSSSNAPRRSSITSNIKNYIRPGSSAGSIRSIATNTSTRSRTQEHWSSIKRKFSNASRISQTSYRKGGGDADRDQNLQGETEIDLNRPLPPLPGLDSYKEKKRHIASLMKKVQSPKVESNAAVDSRSSDHLRISDSATQRDSNHSIPLNFNNISTTSPGSTPKSLNAPIFVHESSSSLERLQSRPHAAKAGISVGVSPLSQSTVPKIEEKKEGFAKRWGGKFSRGKKPKLVVAA
jgi:hypothetical protein